MGTLKAFLKGKNKNELIKDLKIIQDSLIETGKKTKYQESKNPQKTKENNSFLSSLSNKFNSQS